MQNNSNKTLLNTVRFENGIPIRGMFMITEWCVLGDCSQPECHHCFPVVNCTNINYVLKVHTIYSKYCKEK